MIQTALLSTSTSPAEHAPSFAAAEICSCGERRLWAPTASPDNDKSRSRFAAKREGALYLYTIPLWHLLEDGYLWSPLGRAPSPVTHRSSGAPKRLASLDSGASHAMRFVALSYDASRSSNTRLRCRL